MSDAMMRDRLSHEIDDFIRLHPGCTQTDIVKAMRPKYEIAFPRTLNPLGALQKYVQVHNDKLTKAGHVIIMGHPSKTVKGRPMKSYTWRDDNGKN